MLYNWYINFLFPRLINFILIFYNKIPQFF